jgi:trans-aconitate methyltransferase
LSSRCDTLLAIDVAEAALDKARARVPDVAFVRREVPEEFPVGSYDLIVVSEVLYYLDEPAFDATLDAIERTLNGTLLAVHWRPFAERYPLTGDEVHARLRARLGEPAYSRQTDKYNLDAFATCAS